MGARKALGGRESQGFYVGIMVGLQYLWNEISRKNDPIYGILTG